MLIVRIAGGLTSQLINFNLAYQIVNKSKYKHKLILDISDYKENPDFYGLDLVELPKIEKCYLSNKKKKELSIKAIVTYKDVENFMLNAKGEEYYWVDVEKLKGISIFEEAYAFFEKYSELTFANSELISKIKLKTPSRYVEDFKKEIKDKCCVAIHIRRGDFVDLGWENTGDYYVNAIKCFERLNPGVRLYVFTNDHKWAASVLGEGENIRYFQNISFGGGIMLTGKIFSVLQNANLQYYLLEVVMVWLHAVLQKQNLRKKNIQYMTPIPLW